MKKISILGCGWLGLPLAKSLLAKGFSVKGSTTSQVKIQILEGHGIQPFLIELSATEIKGEINTFLENSEILIIDIPPKTKGDANAGFVSKIQNLIPFIINFSIEKVLFVSSTSVYADIPSPETSGLLRITEETEPNPDTESGRQLLEAENLLLNNKKVKTTIVRFGGLIGENRHPIHFLAGRQHLENPEAPINLIHQEDCIGIIERIIEKSLRQAQTDKLVWNEVFNAVAPFHPTRKDYYTQKAMEMNLSLPEFESGKMSSGKIIDSHKITEVLGYIFQKPEL